jgi:acyl carrier protein
MIATDPTFFAARTPEQIKADLMGYPPACVDAALRFHATGNPEALFQMLPGMIEFHLPAGKAKPPAVFTDDLRLNQDLGLDSLALIEMAFVISDFFGISVETREMLDIQTAGDLKAFLKAKLNVA